MSTNTPPLPAHYSSTYTVTTRKYRTGKLDAVRDFKCAALGNHLSLYQLPVPPVLTPKVPNAAGWGYNVMNWMMLGNDKKGDCVLAMCYHLLMGWTQATGNPLTVTEEMVLALYDVLTGGQDTGLVMLDFLKYWRDTGVPCLDSKGNKTIHKILGFSTLDISSTEQLNAATYLFEGIGCGIQLPLSAMLDTGNWAWDPKSPKEGGHAIVRNRYGRFGGHVGSWALEIPHTNEFLNKTLDEAYAIVSEDQLNIKGKSAVGFDKESFLNALANYNSGN